MITAIAQEWSTELLIELFLCFPYHQIVHSRGVSGLSSLADIAVRIQRSCTRSAEGSGP